jgi:hypothetical protein
LRPISPWLLLLAVVVIVAVTWSVTAWLCGITGRQIEAIKPGLTVAARLAGLRPSASGATPARCSCAARGAYCGGVRLMPGQWVVRES